MAKNNRNNNVCYLYATYIKNEQKSIKKSLILGFFAFSKVKVLAFDFCDIYRLFDTFYNFLYATVYATVKTFP